MVEACSDNFCFLSFGRLSGLSSSLSSAFLFNLFLARISSLLLLRRTANMMKNTVAVGVGMFAFIATSDKPFIVKYSDASLVPSNEKDVAWKFLRKQYQKNVARLKERSAYYRNKFETGSPEEQEKSIEKTVSHYLASYSETHMFKEEAIVYNEKFGAVILTKRDYDELFENWTRHLKCVHKDALQTLQKYKSGKNGSGNFYNRAKAAEDELVKTWRQSLNANNEKVHSGK